MVFFALFIFAIAGCDSGETGYIQLRVTPANAAASSALYLEGIKLDFSRSQTVTLQFKTGLLALKGIDSTWAPAICKIAVRKDRISALTVMSAQNPPKCVCEIRAPESDATMAVCT